MSRLCRVVPPSKLVEYLNQLGAMLGRDRFRVKLHTRHRAASVLDSHHHPLLGPSGHAALWTEIAGHRERVVAHDREALRDVLEQTNAIVAHVAQPPMHDHRRAPHRAVEQVSQTLVAEADAEDGDIARAQDVRTHAEVVPALRSAWTGRDDDRVEVPS